MNAKNFFICSFIGILPVILLARTLLFQKRPFEYTFNIFGNVYNIVDGNILDNNGSQYNKSKPSLQQAHIHRTRENTNNSGVLVSQIDLQGHLDGIKHQHNGSIGSHSIYEQVSTQSTADQEKIMDLFGIDKSIHSNISELLNEYDTFDRELRIPKITIDRRPPSEYLKQSTNPCWVGKIFESDIVQCDKDDIICRMNNKVLNQTIDMQTNRLKDGIPWKLRCIPYFYLIGFPKCGTTDLAARISHHPQILGRFKEFHFWSKSRYDTEGGYIETLKPYVDIFDMIAEKIRLEINLFNHSNAITGDNSPSTVFYYNGEYGDNGPIITNADIIKHINPPTAKYICILRDPVERLISEFYYWHNEVSAEKSKMSPSKYFHVLVQDGIREFEHCLTSHRFRYCVYLLSKEGLARGGMFRVALGIYYVFLDDWIKAVGKEALLVIKMEELSINVEAVMASVFDHLNVKPPLGDLDEEFRRHILSNEKRNVQDKRQDMLPETRMLLQDFYKGHNKILRNILKNEKYNWGY